MEMKAAVEVMIMSNLTFEPPKELQMITGASKIATMNWEIKIRVTFVIDSRGNMCTLGSLEMSRWGLCASISLLYLVVIHYWNCLPCPTIRGAEQICLLPMLLTMSRHCRLESLC